MPAIAIIGREILVSGLREFLSSLRISLPVTRLSKAKTGLQMVAITSLLLGDKGAGFPGVEWLGHGCLWLAAGLTLVTGYAYCRATWHHLRLGLPPSPSQP
jgi:phosphatidylglycerophosphate synthase